VTHVSEDEFLLFGGTRTDAFPSPLPTRDCFLASVRLVTHGTTRDDLAQRQAASLAHALCVDWQPVWEDDMQTNPQPSMDIDQISVDHGSIGSQAGSQAGSQDGGQVARQIGIDAPPPLAWHAAAPLRLSADEWQSVLQGGSQASRHNLREHSKIPGRNVAGPMEAVLVCGGFTRGLPVSAQAATQGNVQDEEEDDDDHDEDWGRREDEEDQEEEDIDDGEGDEAASDASSYEEDGEFENEDMIDEPDDQAGDLRPGSQAGDRQGSARAVRHVTRVTSVLECSQRVWMYVGRSAKRPGRQTGIPADGDESSAAVLEGAPQTSGSDAHSETSKETNGQDGEWVWLLPTGRSPLPRAFHTLTAVQPTRQTGGPAREELREAGNEDDNSQTGSRAGSVAGSWAGNQRAGGARRVFILYGGKTASADRTADVFVLNMQQADRPVWSNILPQSLPTFLPPRCWHASCIVSIQREVLENLEAFQPVDLPGSVHGSSKHSDEDQRDHDSHAGSTAGSQVVNSKAGSEVGGQLLLWDAEPEDSPTERVVLILGGHMPASEAGGQHAVIALRHTGDALDMSGVITPTDHTATGTVAAQAARFSHVAASFNGSRDIILLGGSRVHRQELQELGCDLADCILEFEPPADLVDELEMAIEEASVLAAREADRQAGKLEVTLYLPEGRFDGTVNMRNEPHGKGMMHFVSGDMYEGEFQQGVQSGTGTMWYAAGGHEYAGEWADGLPHGVGKLHAGVRMDKEQEAERPLPESLSGQTDDMAALPRPPPSKRAGGLSDRQAVSYEGGWWRGHRHGDATITLSDESVVTAVWDKGSLADSKPVVLRTAWQTRIEIATLHTGTEMCPIPASGTEACQAGSLYVGCFDRQSKRCGKGKCEYADGSSYEGEWRNGRRNGHGVHVCGTTRQVYEGKWVGDTKQGRGTMKYPSGDRYDGLWKDDLPHGQGTMFFATGETFTGTWTRGELDGQSGIRTDKRGRVASRHGESLRPARRSSAANSSMDQSQPSHPGGRGGAGLANAEQTGTVQGYGANGQAPSEGLPIEAGGVVLPEFVRTEGSVDNVSIDTGVSYYSYHNEAGLELERPAPDAVGNPGSGEPGGTGAC